MTKTVAPSIAAGLALLLGGCIRGPLPPPILPLARAPQPGDADRVQDGLRGPVQSVRVTGPDGRWREQSEYDRAGRILHRADERIERWYRYDGRGLLVERIDRGTSLAEAEPSPWLIHRGPFEADRHGRLIADASGHTVVTDERGYKLQDSTPHGSECWRYNAQGDVIHYEKRDRVEGCGWMVTIATPHSTSETKYAYDASGNWIHEWTTTTRYAEVKARHGAVLPMERSTREDESIRAITYFPASK